MPSAGLPPGAARHRAAARRQWRQGVRDPRLRQTADPARCGHGRDPQDLRGHGGHDRDPPSGWHPLSRRGRPHSRGCCRGGPTPRPHAAAEEPQDRRPRRRQRRRALAEERRRHRHPDAHDPRRGGGARLLPEPHTRPLPGRADGRRALAGRAPSGRQAAGLLHTDAGRLRRRRPVGRPRDARAAQERAEAEVRHELGQRPEGRAHRLRGRHGEAAVERRLPRGLQRPGGHSRGRRPDLDGRGRALERPRHHPGTGPADGRDQADAPQGPGVLQRRHAPPSLPPQPRDQPLPGHRQGRRRVHRRQERHGHPQPLGARHLPARDDPLQRPPLRSASLLCLLPRCEAQRLRRPLGSTGAALERPCAGAAGERPRVRSGQRSAVSGQQGRGLAHVPPRRREERCDEGRGADGARAAMGDDAGRDAEQCDGRRGQGVRRVRRRPHGARARRGDGQGGLGLHGRRAGGLAADDRRWRGGVRLRRRLGLLPARVGRCAGLALPRGAPAAAHRRPRTGGIGVAGARKRTRDRRRRLLRSRPIVLSRRRHPPRPARSGDRQDSCRDAGRQPRSEDGLPAQGRRQDVRHPGRAAQRAVERRRAALHASRGLRARDSEAGGREAAPLQPHRPARRHVVAPQLLDRRHPLLHGLPRLVPRRPRSPRRTHARRRGRRGLRLRPAAVRPLLDDADRVPPVRHEPHADRRPVAAEADAGPRMGAEADRLPLEPVGPAARTGHGTGGRRPLRGRPAGRGGRVGSVQDPAGGRHPGGTRRPGGGARRQERGAAPRRLRGRR